MLTWIALALIAYLALHLVISLVVSRFIRSEADYLVAGRNLGVFMATFSLFASWFGSETVMGSSGAIAASGLSGSRADPFGYTVCLLLMGLLIAGPFRAKNYVTVGDFFAEHFGRRNEVLASLVMIPTSVIWAAAQLKAFALIVSAVSPLSVSTALMLSFFIVIAYTCLGGMLGDVVNDLLQGMILIVGLILMLVFVMNEAGGPAAAFALIQPEQLQILAPSETWLEQINVWAIPILGALVAPEALSRTLATKSPQTARRASFYAAGIYLVIGLLPVTIALIGSHLMPIPAQGDAFLPELAKAILPPWAVILILGALTSAILSCVDTTLLSVGALGSHNVLLPILNRRREKSGKAPLSETYKVYLARTLVVLAGLAAYYIATGGEGIYALAQSSSAFGSAGFLICVLGGLYLARISPIGASITLVAGVLLSWSLDHVFHISGAFLFTLAGCALLYLGFWLYERGRSTVYLGADCPKTIP